jgi:hypothetical protein
LIETKRVQPKNVGRQERGRETLGSEGVVEECREAGCGRRTSGVRARSKSVGRRKQKQPAPDLYHVTSALVKAHAPRTAVSSYWLVVHGEADLEGCPFHVYGHTLCCPTCCFRARGFRPARAQCCRVASLHGQRAALLRSSAPIYDLNSVLVVTERRSCVQRGV